MAKRVGSAAKSSSRRCFTFVKVPTPTAPRTPLPTKFAVAEKHIIRFLRCAGFHVWLRKAKYFRGEYSFRLSYFPGQPRNPFAGAGFAEFSQPAITAVHRL